MKIHWQKKNVPELENTICEVKRLFRAFLVTKQRQAMLLNISPS